MQEEEHQKLRYKSSSKRSKEMENYLFTSHAEKSYIVDRKSRDQFDIISGECLCWSCLGHGHVPVNFFLVGMSFLMRLRSHDVFLLYLISSIFHILSAVQVWFGISAYACQLVAIRYRSLISNDCPSQSYLRNL